MKKKCVIIGSGTYGQVYARYLSDVYEEIVFSDNDKTLHGTEFFGVKVIGDDNYVLSKLDKELYDVYIPIGIIEVRRSLISEFRKNGFTLPNYIHPSVKLDKTVELGHEAIYILENTLIMPFAKVESEVMISVCTMIAHHTTIHSGVFVSSGVTIGASIDIHENAYIGISATIMTGVNEIGENSIIGAGSVVIRNVDANVTVVGNPARVLKAH